MSGVIYSSMISRVFFNFPTDINAESIKIADFAMMLLCRSIVNHKHSEETPIPIGTAISVWVPKRPTNNGGSSNNDFIKICAGVEGIHLTVTHHTHTTTTTTTIHHLHHHHHHHHHLHSRTYSRK